MTVSPAKPVERIEMLFGAWTRGDRSKHVGLLDEAHISHREGGFLSKKYLDMPKQDVLWTKWKTATVQGRNKCATVNGY